MSGDKWGALALIVLGLIMIPLCYMFRLADGKESIDPALDRAIYISGTACILIGLYILFS